MAALSIREQLIAELDEMSDQQIASLWSYAQVLRSETLPDDYDESHDPTIGFLSGSTDVARRTKEILREETTPRSGWTQKKTE
jgi:hypothetical protein